MNNKGQALVEFVIIFPIIMMILFVIIDFANVFYQKSRLEGTINDIASYKKNGKTNEDIKKSFDDVTITYNQKGDILSIEASYDVKLITPFSSMFFENPFTISTERSIIYE